MEPMLPRETIPLRHPFQISIPARRTAGRLLLAAKVGGTHLILLSLARRIPLARLIAPAGKTPKAVVKAVAKLPQTPRPLPPPLQLPPSHPLPRPSLVPAARPTKTAVMTTATLLPSSSIEPRIAHHRRSGSKCGNCVFWLLCTPI